MLMQLLYIAFWWNLETLRFCLSVCLSNICFLNIFITWFKTFRITSLQHITHSRRLSPLYIIKCFGESVVNVVHCLIWSFLHSIILTKELHTSLAQHWHQWLTFFFKHIFARNRRVKNCDYQGRKLWVVQKLWNIIKLYSEETLGGDFCVVKYKVVRVLWMVVWCKDNKRPAAKMDFLFVCLYAYIFILTCI